MVYDETVFKKISFYIAERPFYHIVMMQFFHIKYFLRHTHLTVKLCLKMPRVSSKSSANYCHNSVICAFPSKREQHVNRVKSGRVSRLSVCSAHTLAGFFAGTYKETKRVFCCNK